MMESSGDEGRECMEAEMHIADSAGIETKNNAIELIKIRLFIFNRLF